MTRVRVSDVDTPALLLDRGRLQRNIARMARFFEERAAGLRPHYKTPKCPEIARLQLEAGAIGITCAKLAEAETLADAGIGASILVANQVLGASKLDRLVKLASRVPELLVAVDHPLQIESLDAALAGARTHVGALIECDTGMHRCGTQAPEQTVALARQLRDSRVAYRGIMGYEGHAVLIADAAERRRAAQSALARLLSHRQALVDAGLSPEVVSGGGTGTHDITGDAPEVTEIQAGSYVFMDATYRKVRPEFECALTLVTRVLHVRERLAIVDCGMKSLSHDMGMPVGAELPLRCVALSEEHAFVVVDEGAPTKLEVGDLIELLPSHCDTTVNLHDRYWLRHGDAIEAQWPIAARGGFS
ncbi:MAG: DSD1 family PLP-dependent enzyme [Myxococcota bacterium]